MDRADGGSGKLAGGGDVSWRREEKRSGRH
jgi:hypothetical protein